MLYEFKCDECGEVFDRLCKMSERDDIQKCKKCGSEKTNRQVTSSKFDLSGGGWYSGGVH